MVYFEEPDDIQLFEEYVDDIYGKYLLEAHGISTQLISIQLSIYELIIPCIENNKICEIYTGYNWDFEYDDFIKLDNETKQYPLYIKLYSPIAGKQQGFTTRNLTKEKQGDTKILIYVSLKCNDILDTIIHELQHIREMYAKPNINVLLRNKKNIYCNPNLDNDIKTLYKNILYYMSDAEQHAHKQQVYSYVLQHPEITDIDTNDPGLKNASGLKDFYIVWQAYYMYKEPIQFINYLQILNLKFGLLLKQKFNYKNSKLTKQYIEDIKSEKVKFDIDIFNSIGDFIHNNLIKYQREIARTVYFAIEQRDN